jgi:hypothetical protein
MTAARSSGGASIDRSVHESHPAPVDTVAFERPIEPPAEELALYREAMSALQLAGVPFLVGGGYALSHFTGCTRLPGDFDVFVRPRDMTRALDALSQAGFATDLTFPHWLGKAKRNNLHVDVIFSSGNGICSVDDDWFSHAVPARVARLAVELIPAEELIWSKAFVMERERFDGADVSHILRALSERLDWPRLVARFGPHWHVLLSHIILFEFVYPGHLGRIPRWVLSELRARFNAAAAAPPAQHGRQGEVCRGTLLSRAQYLGDLAEDGCRDARLPPLGTMSETEVAIWTEPVRSRP